MKRVVRIQTLYHCSEPIVADAGLDTVCYNAPMLQLEGLSRLISMDRQSATAQMHL